MVLYHMLLSALSQGLLYAPMALGVYVTFCILKTPDLTVDGSFVFGMTACAAITIAGHPFAALLVGALAVFFFTRPGMAIRATGDNEEMVRSSSINADRMRTAGVMLANAQVALSGALICQQQRYADLNCGNGMLVMGLASVIIGQVFFGRRGIVAGLIGAVNSSLLYRIVLQAAYKVNMPSYAVKLLSALIVVAALDPGAAEKVMAVTMEITAREHITTLMITHNMENALRAGSRTILLSGGRIALDLTGEARVRMTSGALAEIFYGGRAG